MIRGLLYDHDGTLIDSIELVVAATNHALASAGLSMASADAVRRGMILTTLKRMGHHAGSDDARVQADLAARYYAEAWRLGATSAHPYAGVRDLLERAHALGLRQGIFSNNEGRFVRMVVAAHGLDRWIDPVLGEEDMAAPKPAPDGILEIARRWGLALSELVVVGDSRVDAGAAQAAGCRSIGVTWGTHDRAALQDAGFDRLIDHADELLPLLPGIG
jgi:phosphoglycolate phosphatase